MEVILGHLSPRDVMSFGATCSRYHQQNRGPRVWKSFCSRLPGPSEPSDWQRLAILKRTLAIRCAPHSAQDNSHKKCTALMEYHQYKQPRSQYRSYDNLVSHQYIKHQCCPFVNEHNQ